jgi:hypothetical protein
VGVWGVLLGVIDASHQSHPIKHHETYPAYTVTFLVNMIAEKASGADRSVRFLYNFSKGSCI